VEILRFANRVPLVYQQGACAITHAVERVPWKSYSLAQPAGGGVPLGPAVLLVHVASTNIPFTSESKDAIADLPEILEEIELGLKEVGRRLRRYLARQDALSERREKEEIIRRILPRMARKLSEILQREEPDIGSVVAKIMGNLLVRQESCPQDGLVSVRIEVENHSDLTRVFKLHEILSLQATAVSPPARVVPMGDAYDYSWKITLGPGERTYLDCRLLADATFSEPVVEGLDPEIVTGARVI
jgi:DNA topoisomerase-6 subunit B